MSRPTPPPSRPAPPFSVPTAPPAPAAYALGLTVHRCTTAHLDLCRRLGVRQIRTTLYADAAGRCDATLAKGVAAAVARELDVLIVLNADPRGWPALAARCAKDWPAAALQVGNECDATIAPADYVALWRRVAAAAKHARLVTAGVGGPRPAVYGEALLAAGIRPHAVAVHAYGPPPSIAIRERVTPVTQALAASGAPTPIWLTEFGIAPRDIRRAWTNVPPAAFQTRIRDEWRDGAVSARQLGLARAYGYCLDADEETGYGIEGTPTAAWLRDTQGVTASRSPVR